MLMCRRICGQRRCPATYSSRSSAHVQKDLWATALPSDLLLQIFRRLGSTALIRSAGVCKAWRRAIIDNASCLHSRPDRFVPDLLHAFFLDTYRRDGRHEYVPAVGAGPSGNVAALDGVDVSSYHRLLASLDGFLLLGGNTGSSSSLCLFNPLTGSHRFLPAVFEAPSDYCKYILVTGYDDDPLPDADDGAGGSSAVRILAVVEKENGITYRIFSSTSGGTWGPVKHSAKIVQEDVPALRVLTDPNRHVVVCGGSVVYWLVIVSTGDGSSRTCLFAMDMRTERTWTTELPEERDTSDYLMMFLLVVATSEDGRQLSLIMSQKDNCQVEVWVLDGDNRWTLQRRMDMESLLFPNCSISLSYSLVCGFCPRSGCLFGVGKDDQDVSYHFLVGIDGSSPRLIQRAHPRFYYMLPYEMDWSTYISKMTYF